MALLGARGTIEDDIGHHAWRSRTSTKPTHKNQRKSPFEMHEILNMKHLQLIHFLIMLKMMLRCDFMPNGLFAWTRWCSKVSALFRVTLFMHACRICSWYYWSCTHSKSFWISGNFKRMQADAVNQNILQRTHLRNIKCSIYDGNFLRRSLKSHNACQLR